MYKMKLISNTTLEYGTYKLQIGNNLYWHLVW